MATPQYERVPLIPDDVNSAGAQGTSATNGHYVASSDWTITVPAGSWTALGASGVTIQVNNSNITPHDAQHRDVNPVALSLQSVARTSASAQGGVNVQFEGEWADFGALSTSAFAGSGNYRYIRLKMAELITQGFDASFSAFLWSYHHAPMV